MNAANNAKLAAKKASGINIHLFSDDHPETTVKGTGFKNAETAYRTIEIVKQKPRNRQVWTINAMYYRAKHHPNQTETMREAMVIFKIWLDQYNEEKDKEKEKLKENKKICRETNKTAADTMINITMIKKEKKQRQSKRKIVSIFKGEGDDGGDNGEINYDDRGDNNDEEDENRKKSKNTNDIRLLTEKKATHNNSTIHRRYELETKYKTMFNTILPEIAQENKWSIRLNHCLMRVALDAYWQCCWYSKLNQKIGALKSMTIPQIENVIIIAQRMKDEGKPYVDRLNKESLVYRDKTKIRKIDTVSTSVVKKECNNTIKSDINNRKNDINATIADADAENITSTIPIRVIYNNSSSPILSNSSDDSSISNSSNTKKYNNNNNNDDDGISNTINFNADALLQVQRASSGRSSCRACKEKIMKDEHRIGMKVWSSGRNMTVWHHPLCFIRDAVCVEKVSRGSSARCKYTGSKFIKGDIRVVLQVGLTKNYYHARTALKPLLAPVYDILLSSICTAGKKDEDQEKVEENESILSKKYIQGLDNLDNDDDRATILACLQ